jgi:nucleotide-binding universal stress UspA family protein
MFSPKKIMVPTDFSIHSDKALDKAIEIAHEFGSKVYLLHVVDENIQQCAMDYCLDPQTVEQLTVDGVKTSKERLEKQAKKAEGANGVPMVLAVKRGIPYAQIVDYEIKNKIDLVVMAPQGRSGIMGHLMGSVADKVVHLSKCPIMLLKE